MHSLSLSHSLMKGGIVLLLLSVFGTAAQRVVNDRSAWFSNFSFPLVLPNLMPTVPYLPATRVIVQSSINVGGDRDFFRFLNVRPGVVRIYSTGSTDTNCTVFLTNGAIVVENDNADNAAPNFEVLFNATANTQYIVLVQSSSNAVTGDYNVLFETNAIDDIGNDLAEAIEVPLSDVPSRFVLSASLEWAGDRDFYKFTPRVDGHILLAAGGGLDTLATFSGTDLIRGITSGALRTNDDTNGVNYFIGYHLKANTLYWLDSGSYNSAGSGAYTITVHFLPGDAAQPLQSFTNHTNSVTFLLGDDSSRTIFSSSFDRSLRQYSLDGTPLKSYGVHTSNVWRVFKLSETRLLSGGCDGTSNNIREWDINGTLIRIWRNHTNCVYGFVRDTRDTNRLYTVSQDGRLVFWNIETGRAEWQWVTGFAIYDVATRPNDDPGSLPLLLLALSSGTIWEYNLETREVIRAYQATPSVIIRRLHVTREFLYVADSAGTVTQFSLFDGLVVRRYTDPIALAVYGVWEHNGFLITTTSGNPSFIRRWNVTNGDLVDTAIIHNGITYHLIFFNGGFWTTGADFQIKFWGPWTTVPRSRPSLPRITTTPAVQAVLTPTSHGGPPSEKIAAIDAATVGSFVLIGIACILILPAAGYLVYSKRQGMMMTQTGPGSPDKTATTSSV